MKVNWDCEICHEPDDGGGIGGWSVHTELWKETMLQDSKLKICIPCFEKRLQRKLKCEDFSRTFDNESNRNVQIIFKAEGIKFRMESDVYNFDTREWDN